jgi:hypothetical protein
VESDVQLLQTNEMKILEKLMTIAYKFL